MPISIAINKREIQCIEIMLEILSMSPVKYDYLRSLRIYVIELLEMQSDIFNKFFDQCFAH